MNFHLNHFDCMSATLRIQGGRRLIRKDQPGIGREGSGDGNSLPFSTGELGRILVNDIFNFKFPKELLDFLTVGIQKHRELFSGLEIG